MIILTNLTLKQNAKVIKTITKINDNNKTIL